mgnify:CR=1 FL=1
MRGKIDSDRNSNSIGKNEAGNKEEMMNKSELGGFSARGVALD